MEHSKIGTLIKKHNVHVPSGMTLDNEHIPSDDSVFCGLFCIIIIVAWMNKRVSQAQMKKSKSTRKVTALVL